MDYLIQLNFYNYLDYFNYTRLLLTCKNFYKNNINHHDNIYKHYLKKKISNNFIKFVKPIIISYYDCFLRIVNFEKTISKMGYKLWEEDVYYLFWKCKYELVIDNKFY